MLLTCSATLAIPSFNLYLTLSISAYMYPCVSISLFVQFHITGIYVYLSKSIRLVRFQYIDQPLGLLSASQYIINDSHPRNTLFSILVTLLGITILVSALQPSNAYPPMLVTPSGMIIPVSPLQPLNASLPMLVTLSGMVIPVSPLQPRNASLPILVTLSEIIIFVSKLNPSNILSVMWSPPTITTSLKDKGILFCSVSTVTLLGSQNSLTTLIFEGKLILATLEHA